jgi:hypothetical protein
MTKQQINELNNMADVFIESECELHGGNSDSAQETKLQATIKRVALEQPWCNAEAWEDALTRSAARQQIIRPLESAEDFTDNLMGQLDALVSKGAQS